MEVTFKTNKDLFDPDFETYKVSSHKPHVTCQKNRIALFGKKQPESEFSCQLIKLFSQYNAITEDPFNRNSYYVVKESGEVHQLAVVENTGKIVVTEQALFCIPSWESCSSHELALLNMKFISEDLCALHDGLDNFYLLNTGTREAFSTNPWNLLGSTKLTLVGDYYSILKCAIKSEQDKLHLAFFTCCKSEEPAESRHLIEWIVLSLADDYSLKLLTKDSLKCNGTFPDFLSFELRQTGVPFLTILSDRILNSSSSVFDLADAKKETKTAVLKVTWNQDLPAHESNQGAIHIALQFDPLIVPVKGVSSDNFTCQIGLDEKTERETIRVSFNGTVLFREDLYGRVDLDQLDYDAKKQTLTVLLKPEEAHSMWPHLFRLQDDQNEVRRDFTVEMHRDAASAFTKAEKDEAAFEEVQGTPMENFSMQQYENIDLQETGTDLLMLRYGLGKGGVIELDRMSRLDCQKWLTNCLLSAPEGKATEACCLRFDVDGIVWAADTDEAAWMKHVATLQAFGFVLASKEQHRFVSMPVLHSGQCPVQFVAVCDYSRRVYVYCQPTPENNNPECLLRKRAKLDDGKSSNGAGGDFTKVVHTAWQHVITLDSDEEILAFVAVESPKTGCIVLTKTKSFLIELPQN